MLYEIKLLLTLVVLIIILIFILRAIAGEALKWKKRKPQIEAFIEQRLGQKITHQTFAIALPESMDIRNSYIVWVAMTKEYAAYCIRKQVAQDNEGGNLFLCRKRDIALTPVLSVRKNWQTFKFSAPAMDDPRNVHTLTLHLNDKRYNLFVENLK